MTVLTRVQKRIVFWIFYNLVQVEMEFITRKWYRWLNLIAFTGTAVHGIRSVSQETWKKVLYLSKLYTCNPSASLKYLFYISIQNRFVQKIDNLWFIKLDQKSGYTEPWKGNIPLIFLSNQVYLTFLFYWPFGIFSFHFTQSLPIRHLHLRNYIYFIQSIPGPISW